MQRSKAPASVEVKQVIGTLGRLLVATGLDDVPAPETFRRAKFGGGPEVEGQFWQLLANILQRIGIVSSEAHLQLKGDHRKLVAAGLWQTGCHADWMYGGEVAEGEEEKHFSSRDLLLALGWLLATETLEKLLTQRVQQLDKTLLTSVPMNTLMVYRELQLDSAFLRRLQWLIGYLRHQRRILLSMLEERTQLLHADCDRVRQLCDLLEAYLYWKQVEKIFWTWMFNPESDTDREEEQAGSPEAFNRDWSRTFQSEHLQHLQNGLRTSEEQNRRTAYRIMLQVERPVRDHIYPAERSNGSGNAPDKIHVSQAVQLLLQTEALLLERRDRQRLANRMQLQEMVGEVEGLVLIPP
ncbi:hypothetical protein F2P81_003942 [Scophthalmus maximus]|uniref:Tubulin epsilon and delta complex protein 1 domain-containing protein n=1 Tax=Scophthalmus maximus TaxID=52904 RepID=A0A6A4TNG7_SCOMX|nr:hypothetical protein F2P81_003942 [Scophthalmus maximus]